MMAEREGGKKETRNGFRALRTRKKNRGSDRTGKKTNFKKNRGELELGGRRKHQVTNHIKAARGG